ncbi:DUF4388 domain-containing protein [candidate division CSSED10-310 bacterium]|uniref:DUF4388 domain-containing protein n=1 Tax=candidate division CSSED10-310 bacterium TaxID=2855610 RepID=A0ABV6YRR4_UNCC1
MEFKGNLSDVGLPFLLQTITMGKMTGTLSLISDEETGNIYVRSGKAIFATSTRLGVRLGEILVEQGKISEEEIENILSRQKKEGKKFGEILRDIGKITEDEIAKCLSFQAEEVIFQLLSWREGKYDFQKNNLPEDLLDVLSEQTSSLISEGKDQIDELLRIRETIPSMNAVLELAPISEKKEKDKDVDLTIDEWQILSLIDGSRSVAKICTISSANIFTTCRILHNLISFDVVVPRTVRLFDDQGVDSSQRLLNMTTMIAVYSQAFASIYQEMSNEIGDLAKKNIRECFRDAKEKFPTLFRNLELTPHGTVDHIILMRNLLLLPLEQQLTSLRNGLNSFLVNTIIRLKDQLGKKKYHQIIREVYSDVSKLFETEEKLRSKLRKNLETVIAHTNQIPSSYKQGLKLLDEDKFEEAFAEFSKVPESNPNFKKAKRHLEKMQAKMPELKKKSIAVVETEPIEIDVKHPEAEYAMKEPPLKKMVSNKSKVVVDLLRGLKLFSNEKYEEAVDALDKVLCIEPLNKKAMKYRELSIQKLALIYEMKIGPLLNVPVLNPDISDQKLQDLTLSPHEGYLLSRINGQYSMKQIISISGLNRYDALKIFHFFINEGLITIKQSKDIVAKSTVSETESVDLGSRPSPVVPTGKKVLSTEAAPSRPRARIIDRNKLAEQHYNNALKAFKEEDYVCSVEELEAAILNNPNNPMYYSLLADARIKKRSYQSVDHYEKGLGELEQKNYGKAIKLFKQAIANDTRNFKYYLTLAGVLVRVPGKRDEALTYFQKALDLDPNNTDLMIRMGQLYKELGQKELAANSFRSCLAIDSGNYRALRELRKLQFSTQ